MAALEWTLAYVLALVDEEVGLAFVCIFAPRPDALVLGFKIVRLEVILQGTKILKDTFAVYMIAFLLRLAQIVH